MEHRPLLDQAALRLYLAAGLLATAVGSMEVVGWASDNFKSYPLLRFFLITGLLIGAPASLGVALNQGWRALRLVWRWADDAVVAYQIKNHPLTL